MSTTPPEVGEATALVYRGLPEVYRDADAAQNTGPSNYPLLRYLSLVLDQLTPLLELLDRLTYTPPDEVHDLPVSAPYEGPGGYGFGEYGSPSADVLAVPVWPTESDTSDLVDPVTANGAWLPWLCQLVGVNSAGLTNAQLRERLANLDVWQRHGSAQAIVALMREALGLDPIDGLEDGDQFITKGEYGGPTEYDEDEQAFVICLHFSSYDDPEDAEAVLAHVEQERPAGFVFTLGDI